MDTRVEAPRGMNVAGYDYSSFPRSTSNARYAVLAPDSDGSRGLRRPALILEEPRPERFNGGAGQCRREYLE